MFSVVKVVCWRCETGCFAAEKSESVDWTGCKGGGAGLRPMGRVACTTSELGAKGVAFVGRAGSGSSGLSG